MKVTFDGLNKARRDTQSFWYFGSLMFIPLIMVAGRPYWGLEVEGTLGIMLAIASGYFLIAVGVAFATVAAAFAFYEAYLCFKKNKSTLQVPIEQPA